MSRDGVPTTHYRATISFFRLGASNKDIEEAVQELGTRSLPVDYWTDSAGTLRRLRLSLTILQSPPSSTTSTVEGEISVPFAFRYPITMSLDLRLSNYGIPVHIDPPAPDQISSHSTCQVSADDVHCEDG